MSLAINWYDEWLSTPSNASGWVLCPRCNGLAPAHGWHACSAPPATGWRCPGCQCVWGPQVEGCRVCNKSEINV